MMELNVSEDFDFQSEEYSDLYTQSDCTAFQHPVWQTAMQQHVRKQIGLRNKTLQFRCKKSGQLVGILPLVARKKMGTNILEFANLGLVDYALPTLHTNFWQWVPNPSTLSVELDRVLGRYDMLRIKHMPSNDPNFLRLLPNACMERAKFSAHVAELGSDYDSWRTDVISKAERKSRDKKRRAMMRNGDWQMNRLTDPADITEAFNHLKLYHKERFADRPGKDMLQDGSSFRFYVDLACHSAESGFSRTYSFTYDGDIVAVQFGLHDGDRYLYLIMGVDYERMGKYSPGLLMTEDIIRDCIKDGIKTFDLTVGDEPYKAKFGTKPVAIYTLWHASSMLGTMGRTVADLMHKQKVGNNLLRWMSN
ncbi:GNAT family N-acetyltransferase [Cohaesibacter intestini]|uniref:GNAT family N-acetyltransferase n=1 Tax=Cohaesibacter intestini TaxID=2211145 RepID=UPI000DEA7EA8|nr:GNAT family N-acetyltransferase [Cohaesibacter intestini]